MGMTVDQMSALKAANDLFKDFAVSSDKNTKAVAMFKLDGTGKEYVIQNKNDHVRGLFSSARTQENMEANNATRDKFMSLILNICGVTDKDTQKLPASIRSAMKLGDYGKGKPLTARRITTVMNAVYKFVDDNRSVSGATTRTATYKTTNDTLGSSTVKLQGFSSKNVVRQNNNLFLAKDFQLDLDDDDDKKKV